MSKKLETPTNRPPSIDQIARAISDLDLPHPLLVDAAREAVNNFNGGDVIEEARKGYGFATLYDGRDEGGLGCRDGF